MLDLKNYSKGYNGRPPVIQLEELHLPHGLYWLQGKNGAGKTTFLKSLAGLVPYSGDIRVAGADQQRQPVLYRKLVGYAEAEPLFPDFATGTDLLRFYARTKGGSENKQQQLVQELGMTDYIRHKTSTYSSGMLKKLSLVLAFTGNPALILLDEPLTTLDTATSEALLEIIKSTFESGVSFIITSHHPLDKQMLPYTVLQLHQDSLQQELTHA